MSVSTLEWRGRKFARVNAELKTNRKWFEWCPHPPRLVNGCICPSRYEMNGCVCICKAMNCCYF